MIRKIMALITFIVICFGSLNITFSEKKGKTIRIPDYAMNGFIYTNEIGARSGYSYEIFQEITKYTGWNYEYVECDRSQCIDMLKSGELDIIDSCVYTEDRAKDIAYSNINAGFGNKAVVVKADNEKFNPNDFQNYDGIKIGIVDEPFWENAINSFTKEKGFSPQIIKFNSYNEKFKAFNEGSIDAVLTMSIQKSDDYKILFEFDATEFYFAVNIKNTELMKELNNAMLNIWLSDSTYFSKVYNRYYEAKKNDVFFLSEDEKEFVQNHKVIKAIASNNREPFSFFDENGEYSGIVKDIIVEAASKAGFSVEFQKTDNYQESLQKIWQGDINLICDFFYDYSWAEKNGIKMTSPYIASLQYSAITGKDIDDNDKSNLRVAYVDNYFFNEKFLFPKLNKNQMILYNTEKECIEAVNSGDADITYVPSFVAEEIIRNGNYYDISMTAYPEFHHAVCAGVGKDEDFRLLTILTKAIKSIDDDEINSIVSKHTMFQKDDVNFITFIERNSMVFICALLFMILIVVSVFFYIFKIKKKYNETIFKLAYIDKVTGIWNMNKFVIEAAKKIEENDFNKNGFCVISFDISKFRVVNDNYGKFVGDRVLKYIADNLINELVYGGIAARVNMDNFIVMTPFSGNETGIEFLTNMIEKNRFYEKGGVAFKLIFQCGVYSITNKNISIDKAIDMAEIARKEAKSTRNDKIVFFDKKMEEKTIRYKEIEERMEKALLEREFVVYYQPKINMETEKIIGAEALVRWISKDKGFMNPEEFIPVFEKEGFIIELDFFLLEEAIKVIRDWLDNNKKPITISVNQSRVHLSNPYYIERLKNLINKYQVPTKFIELELTESLFMDIDAALETVKKIKELGFSVSVDDFGSGFSSLNMLKSMPIDVVKIDREFLNESENSQKAQKIISKIVEMAKELDMDVICEGVEKIEQAEFLKSIGCYYAQGFLYAKPMPEMEFFDRVKNVIDEKKTR